MAKFLDQTGLSTLLSRLKGIFDTKIDKPETGETGQVLVKTDEGVEWQTLVTGDNCECEDFTEPELDEMMGLLSESGFDIEIGGSGLQESYSVDAKGTSYTISLVENSGSGRYNITKVTPSENWVTVDADFTKLTVAGRGTVVGEARSCNVDIEINSKITKTLIINQDENKETLTLPSKYKYITISRWAQVDGSMIKPSDIDKCKIEAVYSSGETHTYEFAPCGRDLAQTDPRFEYQNQDPYHYQCNMSNDGIYIERLTDRSQVCLEHFFIVHLDWDEKNFADSYYFSVWQEGYDQGEDQG